MPPMPSCIVYECHESSSKKTRKKKNDPNHAEEEPDLGEVFRKLFAEEEVPLKGVHTKFYSIPDNSEENIKWKIAGGRVFSAYTGNARFCSNHFDKSQYDIDLLEHHEYRIRPGMRILKKGALPNKNLPRNPKPKTESQTARDSRMQRKRKAEIDNPNSEGYNKLKIKIEPDIINLQYFRESKRRNKSSTITLESASEHETTAIFTENGDYIFEKDGSAVITNERQVFLIF